MRSHQKPFVELNVEYDFLPTLPRLLEFETSGTEGNLPRHRNSAWDKCFV